MSETFSEEAVNQLLANQEIKIRLDGVEGAVTRMDNKLEDHFREEEFQSEQLLAKITEGAADRRKCEQSLRTEMYSTFVKKDDLRIYAILVVAAVTATTGFIAWLGTQNSNVNHNQSMEQMVNRIDKMLTERLGVK